MTDPTTAKPTTDEPGTDEPGSTDNPAQDWLGVGPERLSGALEALLMVATEPVSAADLAATCQMPEVAVTEALEQLREFYHTTGRGFELRHVGGGWRYYTSADYADVVAHSVIVGQNSRLSQAGLETLAVIAYLQPISRARVSAVRGVNVDGVVRTLITRHLIAEVDHDPSSGAGLLATTPYFLERMGLSDLNQLPPLAPLLPDAAQLEAELAQFAPAGESTEPVELPVTDDGSPANDDHETKDVDHETTLTPPGREL